MDKDTLVKLLVALFCAVCIVCGSMLLHAFNQSHPLVIGDGFVSHLLAGTGSESRPSGSAWD